MRTISSANADGAHPVADQAVADLGACAVGQCNNVLVDVRGHAYISSFDFELWYEARQASQFGKLAIGASALGGNGRLHSDGAM